MKTKDFINSLPQEVCETVKNIQLNFKHKLSDDLVISDISKVYCNDITKEYEISINHSDSHKKLERSFLHEFFHCVQYEEGFSRLSTNILEQQIFIRDISSLILDINVINRLEEVGYKRELSITNKMVELILKLYSAGVNPSTEDKITDIITLAICKIYFQNSNIKRTEFIFAKKYFQMYQYYNKCVNMLHKYNPNKKEDVYKIFEELINIFSLKCQISSEQFTN